MSRLCLTWGCQTLTFFLFSALLHSQERLSLGPCDIPGAEAAARCGNYEVFENRTTRSGRKIALRVMVLPARAPSAAPDPVFLLVGGPGASAVNTAAGGGRKYLIDRLRRERDVILVDQRGTGTSNPLHCAFFGDGSAMAPYLAEIFPVDKVKECRTSLEQKADLALYTTPIAMDDLDDVRAALGYERINLYGGSYGTTAAFAYLRQHPERVRAVALFGVAPVDFRNPLPLARGVEHALTRLFEDCAADPECAKTYPDLANRLDTVLARLEKAPARFETIHPQTGRPEQIELTRTGFIDQIRLLLYSPETANLVPALVEMAARNDYSPLATYGFIVTRPIEDQIARGMYLSVTCAQDMPFVTEADITRETTGTRYGPGRLRLHKRACAEWVKGQVPAGFVDPVKSNTPVLMISGDLDPVTPPGLAKAALGHLPNGRQILVRNVGHAITSTCIDDIFSEFITRGATRELDATCVENIRRPPFVIIARPATAITSAGPAVSMEGQWEGALAIGATRLRLILKVTKESDGTYKGTLDSPDQGVANLPVDSLRVEERILRFDMKLLRASYEGAIEPDGKTITGGWRQGLPLPLVFKRAE